jgi:RimJ/RimL family protein N-acetyltransferase
MLKNGTRVLIRPARASDVAGVRDLFYHLSQEDIYTRFFRGLRSLSTSEAERLCNVNYDTEVAFLAVTGTRENEKIVGSSCYFTNLSTNTAEVAYMIAPQWQGAGLGKALQERMIEYGKCKGLRGFTAVILSDNPKMINLSKRACNNVSFKRQGITFEVTMLFD